MVRRVRLELTNRLYIRQVHCHFANGAGGGPSGTRTPDHSLMRRTHSPTMLKAHIVCYFGVKPKTNRIFYGCSIIELIAHIIIQHFLIFYVLPHGNSNTKDHIIEFSWQVQLSPFFTMRQSYHNDFHLSSIFFKKNSADF